MAVFTNDITFWDGRYPPGYVSLWADTDDELYALGLECGAELTAFAVDETYGILRCGISKDQQAVALFLGAVQSDWLGPAEMQARRRRDIGHLEFIRGYRQRHGGPSTPYLQGEAHAAADGSAAA